MVFDKRVMFCEGQAVNAAGPSSGHIDLGPGLANLGVGGELYLHVQVVEDFDNLTSLKVALQEDDNDSFSSPTTLVESGAVPLAELKAGYVFNLAVPAGISQRFQRLYFTPSGTAPTTGKITAGYLTDRAAGVHPDAA